MTHTGTQMRKSKDSKNKEPHHAHTRAMMGLNYVDHSEI